MCGPTTTAPAIEMPRFCPDRAARGVLQSKRDAGLYLLAGAFTTSENEGGVELWIDDVVVRVR